MDKSSSDLQRLLCGKRIIFILYSMEVGGAERQALYLARYLQDICLAEVEIWAFCNPGRLVDICDEYHIKWRLIPIKIGFNHRRIILNSICLGIALLLARPQILLPYMTPANVYCGLSWRFTAAKVCIWNQRNAGHTIYNLEFEKKAAHKVTALVANTELGADFIRNTYNLSPKGVHVIHNGIESAPQKTIIRSLRTCTKFPKALLPLAW